MSVLNGTLDDVMFRLEHLSKVVEKPVEERFFEENGEDKVVKYLTSKYKPLKSACVEKDDVVFSGYDDFGIEVLRRTVDFCFSGEDSKKLKTNSLYDRIKDEEVLQIGLLFSKDCESMQESFCKQNQMKRLIDYLTSRGYDFLAGNLESDYDFYFHMPNNEKSFRYFMYDVMQIMEPPEFVKNGLMNSNLYEMLLERGYTDLKKLIFGPSGGLARYVFEADSLTGKKVVKVDIPPEKRESLNSKDHYASGYTTEREVFEILSKIMQNPHQNFVRVDLPIVYLENGQRKVASIEEKVKGLSMSDCFKNCNPGWDVDDYKSLFSGLVGAIKHLHVINRMLHRDLKPSNVLVINHFGSLEAKLNDFELACRINEPKIKAVASMGGHFVRDPDLGFNGEQSQYTEKSEIYSLGVLMYYALTGKYIFEFHPNEEFGIVYGTKENLIDENGRYNLDRYEDVLDKSLKELRKDLRKKDLPRYDKIIRKCMTKKKKNYDCMGELSDHLKIIQRTPVQDFMRSLKKWMPRAGYVAAGFGGAYLVIQTLLGTTGLTTYQPPSAVDLLINQQRIENISSGYPTLLSSSDYHLGIKKLISDINSNEEIEKTIEDLGLRRINHHYNVPLVNSLVRSILMEKDLPEFKEGRLDFMPVPIDFIKTVYSDRDIGPKPDSFLKELKNKSDQLFWMGKYVSQCFSYGDGPADVYVKALCSNEEVSEAISSCAISETCFNKNVSHQGYIRMGDIKHYGPVDYFSSNDENGNFKAGYNKYLDCAKRRIINRAVQIYFASDSDGNVSMENLRKNVYKSRMLHKKSN